MLDCGVLQFNDDLPLFGVALLEFVLMCFSDVESMLEELESFRCETFVDVELRLHLDASPNQVVLQGSVTELHNDGSFALGVHWPDPVGYIYV